MARVDALTAIGKKVGVDNVHTADDGTLTVWLKGRPMIGHNAIIDSVKGTGYHVSNYGHDVDRRQYFIELKELKANKESGV